MKPEEDNNHAVIEFARSGKRADSCTVPHRDGTPCQLNHAVDFIRAAKELTPADDQLNVIVYIHGNENWAGEESDNYPHFRQTINCLNLGTERYYQTYLTGKRIGHEVLDCADTEDPTPYKAHFVGIYLGWQGNTTGTLLNMREAVAHRMSNKDNQNSEIAETLYKLRDAAKGDGNGDHVRFIIMGHSFGGVILEQTALKIYSEAASNGSWIGECEDGSQEGVLPFADLMVTIAAAEHAVQAKKLIDLLQRAQYVNHQSFCRSADVAPSMYRPILVSLVSKHDFWSYGFGSGARHLLGHEPETIDAVSHPASVVEDPPGARTVEWQTPSVVAYFQNICYLSTPFEKGGKKFEGEPVCDMERNHLPADPKSMRNAEAFVLPEGADPLIGPLAHLYVRFNCKLASSNDNDDSRPPCSGNYPGAPVPEDDLHVWNHTPFWIGAIDTDIFNGHGPFGFPKFNQLLADMGGTFKPLPSDRLLPTPAKYK